MSLKAQHYTNEEQPMEGEFLVAEDGANLMSVLKNNNNDDDEEDEGDWDDEYTDLSTEDEDYGRRALAFDRNQLSNSTDMPVNGHDFLKLVEEERSNLPAIKSVPINSLPIKRLKLTPNESAAESLIPQTAQASFKESALKDTETSIRCKESDLHQQANMSPLVAKIKLKTNSSRKCAIANDNQNSRLDKYRELSHHSEIVNNFRKLRDTIDDIRKSIPSRPIDVQEDLSEKQYGKCLQRSERRANSLIGTINIGHSPDVRILLKKSQLEIHLILKQLVDQYEQSSNYSILHADWIYGLIAVLREPVEPDILSTLRRLAKLCIIRRDAHLKRMVDLKNEDSSKHTSSSLSTLDEIADTKDFVKSVEQEEFKSCLLLVCIVRYHFGQFDLK